MARMVPPQVQAGCASPGEEELFLRLRDDPGTSDWIVLHSLDVAQHRRQVSGEIDFVVIIPALGVLCIEVKACHDLRRSEGLWYYGSAVRGDARGPFKQASESMHSIRERIVRAAPRLDRIVFWSCVVFPYIEFTAESPEWHAWQVVDRRAFSRRPISAALTTVLIRARERLLATPTARWFDPVGSAPDDSECELLLLLLRPDFEAFESPRSRIHNMDVDVKRYTHEQFLALDAMTMNPRVMFEGPAGTGKTLLAIECARRSAAAGRNVLFLCYNRLLGGWLADQVLGVEPPISVATLHKYMLRVANQVAPPDDADQEYWEHTLPSEAMHQLIGENQPFVYDELILDEAQDVLRSDYLDVLDLSIRGGLAAGRWRLFGDFENQSIYDTDRGESLIRRLEERVQLVPRFALRINCRNTPRIAELVHILGGLNPPYAAIRRPDDGVEPQILYYSDAAEQQAVLDSVLRDLGDDGFRGPDVVLLSPRSAASCAANISIPSLRSRIRAIGPASSRHSSYCSIHAFTGMECRAVVVTDVEEVGTPSAMSLFYIATTRALHRLVALAHERVRSEARSLVRRQLAADH